MEDLWAKKEPRSVDDRTLRTCSTCSNVVVDLHSKNMYMYIVHARHNSRLSHSLNQVDLVYRYSYRSVLFDLRDFAMTPKQ